MSGPERESISAGIPRSLSDTHIFRRVETASLNDPTTLIPSTESMVSTTIPIPPPNLSQRYHSPSSMWSDPLEDTLSQQIERIDLELGEQTQILESTLRDLQLTIPVAKMEKVRQSISEVNQGLLEKTKLQASLIEVKTTVMMRSRRYTERCEQKIVGLREKYEKMEQELQSQINKLQTKLKHSTESETASTVLVDVITAKYNVLKSEYFKNVLTARGRKLAKAEKGTDTATFRALKETFDRYFEAKEEEVRTMVRNYTKIEAEEGLDEKTVASMSQMADQAFGSQVNTGPTGKVTLVFTDVQGSTEMWDKAEIAMEAGLEMHNSILRRLLAKYEGYEVKTEGDAFMVAFGSAVNALQWCVESQHELLRTEWPVALLSFPGAGKVFDESGNLVFNGIRVRMGLHVGNPKCEVDPCTKRMDYFGPMVNLSARISSKGQGGQIVASQEFLDAVQSVLPEIGEGVEYSSLGPQNFKGISRPVEIFQMTPIALRGRRFELPPKADPDFDPKEQFFVDDAPLKLDAGFIQAAVNRIQRRRPGGNNVPLQKVAQLISQMQGEIRWLRGSVAEVVEQCQAQCRSFLQTSGGALVDVFRLYMASRDEIREILHRREITMPNSNPVGGISSGGSTSNLFKDRSGFHFGSKRELPKTPHFPDELVNLDWFAPLARETFLQRKKQLHSTRALKPAASEARLVVASGCHSPKELITSEDSGDEVSGRQPPLFLVGVPEVGDGSPQAIASVNDLPVDPLPTSKSGGSVPPVPPSGLNSNHGSPKGSPKHTTKGSPRIARVASCITVPVTVASNPSVTGPGVIQYPSPPLRNSRASIGPGGGTQGQAPPPYQRRLSVPVVPQLVPLSTASITLPEWEGGGGGGGGAGNGGNGGIPTVLSVGRFPQLPKQPPVASGPGPGSNASPGRSPRKL